MTKYLKAIWFWMYIIPLTFIVFALLGLTHAIFRFFGQSVHKVAHIYASIWARLVLGLMPGWKVEITGKENLPKTNDPVVIVANHVSAADVWSIYCLDVQFRWLAKDSVFRYPMIGPSMRWAGYIPITRGNKESHKEAMRLSAESIKEKVNMFFFPEGTRSETGELRPFKIGAFKLAAQENVAVLPLALSGAKDLVKKGSTLPGRATMRIHVLPREYRKDNEDLEHYAARVRGLIAATLAEDKHKPRHS